MQWVIQSNLFNEREYGRFMESVDRYVDNYITVEIIPFSHEIIPNLDSRTDRIAFGSTSLIKTAKKLGWNPGTFHNNYHSISALLSSPWNDYYLNKDCEILNFKDLNISKPMFIRPDDDLKLFNGQVIDPEDLEEWKERILGYNDFELKSDSKVVVSDVKEIYQEFRFFIVNQTIASCCMYKCGDMLVKDENFSVDYDVIWFVSSLISCKSYYHWKPAEAYVLDIARTPDGLKILEINTLNSSGFYGCNTNDIVQHLVDLLK